MSTSDLGKLAWAAAHLADAVIFADRDGVVEFVNPAFEALTGLDGARAVGCTLSILGTRWSDLQQDLEATIAEGEVFRGVLVNERPNGGGLCYIEWVISPLPDAAGAITHFIATGRDVTDRIRSEQRLKHIAEHDPLTGLPNRSLFLDRLAQLVKHSERRTCGFAVGIIDVDRFKAVNDTLGHLAGDALLRVVAHRIQWCIRASDTLARLGGDEFGLILADVADRRAAAKVAGKVIGAFRAPVRLEQRSLRVSVSLGICMYPEDGADGYQLLQGTDGAMYCAKKGGGDRYWFRPPAAAGSAMPRGNPAHLASLR